MVPLRLVWGLMIRLARGEVALAKAECPRCEKERQFARLGTEDVFVRCLSCRASIVTLSLISVLRQCVEALPERSAYELSGRGALVSWLGDACASLTCSELMDDVALGECRDGIYCQDVQQLTFCDESFDLCTSLEVFEHVPRDDLGFAEVLRVLRPGGVFAFTVPIVLSQPTVERAQIADDGSIRHLCEPEYHGDPLRNGSPILAFRTYGFDIVQRLLDAGFATAGIQTPPPMGPWHLERPVVIARK